MYHYTISLNNLLILNSERHMNSWLHRSLLPLVYWDTKTTPRFYISFTTNVLLHWQKEESPPLMMPLLKLKVLITMKLMMMMMERMVLVYASSPIVHLKPSKAKGKLCMVRTSKCIISSSRTVTLLMAGEQWKYAIMQGRSLLDLLWMVKCFPAGLKEWSKWIWQAATIIATIYIVTRFPELGMCDLDWKSKQIASKIYLQWRTHWISKQETEKSKGKFSSKQLFEENSKDDPSHKTMKVMKVSESMSKSVPVSLDLSLVDFLDSVCFGCCILFLIMSKY